MSADLADQDSGDAWTQVVIAAHRRQRVQELRIAWAHAEVAVNTAHENALAARDEVEREEADVRALNRPSGTALRALLSEGRSHAMAREASERDAAQLRFTTAASALRDLEDTSDRLVQRVEGYGDVDRELDAALDVYARTAAGRRDHGLVHAHQQARAAQDAQCCAQEISVLARQAATSLDTALGTARNTRPNRPGIFGAWQAIGSLQEDAETASIEVAALVAMLEASPRLGLRVTTSVHSLPRIAFVTTLQVPDSEIFGVEPARRIADFVAAATRARDEISTLLAELAEGEADRASTDRESSARFDALLAARIDNLVNDAPSKEPQDAPPMDRPGG